MREEDESNIRWGQADTEDHCKISTERDRYLTEQMGECWHEWEQVFKGGGSKCKTCGKYWPLPPDEETRKIIQDCKFSTWDGFGKLWEWAKHQKWWDCFFWQMDNKEPLQTEDIENLIHPGRFANAVYDYLKSKDNK